MPKWFLWFQVANTLLVAAAALLLAVLRLGDKGGRLIRGTEESSKRMDQVELDCATKYALILQRLDRAGEKTSELATEVQAMPERFRTIFISLDRSADLFAEARDDRKRLWHEVEQICFTLRRRPRSSDWVDS